MTNKIRALVVDDEAAILRFLKPALEANNYRADERWDDRGSDQAHRGGHARYRCPRSRTSGWRRQGCDPAACGHGPTCRSSFCRHATARPKRSRRSIWARTISSTSRLASASSWHECAPRFAIGWSARRETPVLRTADLEIDNVRHRVMRAGVEVRLTPKEFELLSFLARHAGKVVTHRQILTAVWGPAHASRHAISAGLYRPAPAENRAGPWRSAHHHHRARNRVSDRRDRRPIIF